MPPQNFGDSDSDSDVIPAKPRAKNVVEELSDDPMEEEEGETGDMDVEEEEYIVEAIKDHKYEGKTLKLHVKWKGYEKKSDMTWEPEDNLAGASEVLEEYYKAIGGRPTYTAPTGKRGRVSGVSGATPVTASGNKRARTLANARNGVDSPVPAPSPVSAPAPAHEEKSRLPSGSWEDEIVAIDTIEKTDKGLICYVQWNGGKKTQHEIHTLYTKCPQKVSLRIVPKSTSSDTDFVLNSQMLHFYEQHLVFKESGSL
ncbi:hypothetical protein RUND412_000098 [Rhizina undulata]